VTQEQRWHHGSNPKRNDDGLQQDRMVQHSSHYQYHYDSDDLMFVVHQESESKPNMELRIHERSLHYYDSRKEHHLTFVNTVSENKTGFAKWQIKGA
jgi:hypothetical protein